MKNSVKEELSLASTLLRWGIFLVLTVGLLGFIGNLIGLYSMSFFAPKAEQIRYNTFKQSQSYNDGMIRDLEDLKLEYQHADPDGRKAMQSIILHRFSVYDVNKLPVDLQGFYLSLQ